MAKTVVFGCRNQFLSKTEKFAKNENFRFSVETIIPHEIYAKVLKLNEIKPWFFLPKKKIVQTMLFTNLAILFFCWVCHSQFNFWVPPTNTKNFTLPSVSRPSSMMMLWCSAPYADPLCCKIFMNSLVQSGLKVEKWWNNKC